MLSVHEKRKQKQTWKSTQKGQPEKLFISRFMKASVGFGAGDRDHHSFIIAIMRFYRHNWILSGFLSTQLLEREGPALNGHH